jgi:uncharacterized protein (TIGR03067 family)
MKIRVLAIIAIGLMLAIDASANDDAKPELKKLEGVWQPTSVEQNGNKLPAGKFQDERVIIKGDQLTITKGGKVMQRATLSVDPVASPKTFVKTVVEGVNKGKKYHGIYELDGDTLRECRTSADQERPKEFAGRSGASLFVSKRIKP